jgi:chloramphenicol O-acetyltransferase type B
VRKRFTDAQRELLLMMKWWDWPLEKIKANVHLLCAGEVATLWEAHNGK